MLHALSLLMAQAGDAKEAVKDAPGGLEGLTHNPLLLFLAMGLAFLLLVILPQQRREKRQREALLGALKKNDEVLTAAGIFGVVANIKEGGDEVTLKIDDGARMRVLRSSIVKIMTKESKEGA